MESQNRADCQRARGAAENSRVRCALRGSVGKMRLSDVIVHRIAIADPPLRSSYGLHAPYALRTILELKSDDGFTGIAETYGGEAPANALEQLRPRLLGADPFRVSGLLVDLVEGQGAGDVLA